MLLVGVIGLAGWVGWQVARPPSGLSPAPGATTRDVPDVAALPSPESLLPPPIETLSETVRRPLFTASRRPPDLSEAPAPVSESVEPDAPTLAHTLSAVVVDGDRRIAYLRARGDGKLVSLGEGDGIAGWQVTRIEPERVSLERDGERHVLELRRFDPPGEGAASVPRRAGQDARSPTPVRAGEGDEAERPRRAKRGPRQEALRRLERRQTQQD